VVLSFLPDYVIFGEGSSRDTEGETPPHANEVFFCFDFFTPFSYPSVPSPSHTDAHAECRDYVNQQQSTLLLTAYFWVPHRQTRCFETGSSHKCMVRYGKRLC